MMQLYLYMEINEENLVKKVALFRVTFMCEVEAQDDKIRCKHFR
jgi:hypothetical protein